MTVHLIVVDDNTANLQTAAHILKKNNMHVTTLDSGQALLNHISGTEIPDLILLDIKMPEMDGFETLARLRQREKELGIEEIPVIFLTADETADTERLGFEAGVSDYIRKPFDPEILLRRVGNVVTKEKRLSSLRTEADTDKLTGFLNKSAAARVMSGLCSSDLGALLMIDLDAFKLVNDLYGHKMGDNILICFAAILRNAVPEGSRIGRIGGDEFVVFASGICTQDAVAALTAQINSDLVAKAKELMGQEVDIPLGASVGGVFVPTHGDDYDTLFRMADKALYHVKKNGKHGYSLYHTDDVPEDAQNVSSHGISKLSEILGERSIPNVALQLDKEAFAYVYRYIMRYMMRNQRSFYKLLFTLRQENGIDEHSYKESCDAFGTHICESLRKTDIVMRNRFNQYFVLLTDIREHDIGTVTGNLIRRWQHQGGRGVIIAYESEFVSIPCKIPNRNAEKLIAVVDDDETSLRKAGVILSKAGYRVSAMKSGQTLLKFLTDHKPDLILLDIRMPGADGFETLKMLRENKAAADIPVVFLTADESGASVRTGLLLGAADYIAKPFLPELLIHRLRTVIDLAELRRSQYGTSRTE